MDPSRLRARAVSSKLRQLNRKSIVKLSDQISKKNPLRMMKPLSVSDAMELRSTKKDFPVEDAMDQETLTPNSSMI